MIVRTATFLHSRLFRSLLLLIPLALGLLSSGCTKVDPRVPVFPVRGRVLFNGQPLAHAFVVLHPAQKGEHDDLRPRAQADKDGAFRLSTYDSEDGAPAGEYLITVQKFKAPTESDVGPAVNLLPARYASTATSDLRIRIEENPNELKPLQLKP